MTGDGKGDEEDAGNVGGPAPQPAAHGLGDSHGGRRWLGVLSVGELSPPLRHKSCRGGEKGTGLLQCWQEGHGKSLSGGQLNITWCVSEHCACN